MGAWKALTSVYITATVAVCVVVGLYAVPRIRRKVRFVLGGLCAVGSWLRCPGPCAGLHGPHFEVREVCSNAVSPLSCGTQEPHDK